MCVTSSRAGAVTSSNDLKDSLRSETSARPSSRYLFLFLHFLFFSFLFSSSPSIFFCPEFLFMLCLALGSTHPQASRLPGLFIYSYNMASTKHQNKITRQNRKYIRYETTRRPTRGAEKVQSVLGMVCLFLDSIPDTTTSTGQLRKLTRSSRVERETSRFVGSSPVSVTMRRQPNQSALSCRLDDM